MGQFTRGEIVLVSFPFSDLSQTKLRPALVLAEVDYGDVLLCQITSKTYGDRNALSLEDEDFVRGSLHRQSYARPTRILTGSPRLIRRSLGRLKEEKHDKIVSEIKALLD